MTHRRLMGWSLVLVLAGCREYEEAPAPGTGAETSGAVAMSDGSDDGGSEGSDARRVDPEDETTGGDDPEEESGSSDDDAGSSGAESSGGADETPGCAEDMFEHNDELGFPATWDGTNLGARSCGHDPDWFLLEPAAVKRVRLEQATGIALGDEPFANLVLEAYCGQQLCDADERDSAEKVVSFDACDCPDDERRFVHVAAGDPINPPSGTRYGLFVP